MLEDDVSYKFAYCYDGTRGSDMIVVELCNGS